MAATGSGRSSATGAASTPTTSMPRSTTSIELGLADPDRARRRSACPTAGSWSTGWSARRTGSTRPSPRTASPTRSRHWANSDTGPEYDRASLLGDPFSADGVDKLWRQSPLRHVAERPNAAADAPGRGRPALPAARQRAVVHRAAACSAGRSSTSSTRTSRTSTGDRPAGPPDRPDDADARLVRPLPARAEPRAPFGGVSARLSSGGRRTAGGSRRDGRPAPPAAATRAATDRRAPANRATRGTRRRTRRRPRSCRSPSSPPSRRRTGAGPGRPGRAPSRPGATLDDGDGRRVEQAEAIAAEEGLGLAGGREEQVRAAMSTMRSRRAAATREQRPDRREIEADERARGPGELDRPEPGVAQRSADQRVHRRWTRSTRRTSPA